MLLTGCFSPALDGKFDCGNDGSCPPGLVCVKLVCVAGGDLAPNAVDAAMPSACQPSTCRARECGEALDGCGGKIMCGACSVSENCGGGGANVCGATKCTPKTCKLLNAECGLASDGCATVLDCGTCNPGEVCGARTPHRCD